MSILDYEQKDLSPDIWDKSHMLKMGVKSFILKALEGFFMEKNIKDSEFFIKGIFIGSSLATYYYTDASDLDIKIIVDCPAFKMANKSYSKFTDEQLMDSLVDQGRASMWLTASIPGTAHVLDVYFIEYTTFTEHSLIKYDSLYSILKDQWIKIPKKIDRVQNPSYILDRAKQSAKDYLDTLSIDLSQAKRDTLDFYILVDHLKSLDDAEIKNFSTEIQKSLDAINDSLEQLLHDRQLLKDLRKNTFSKKELDSQLELYMQSLNYAEGNLVFKIIQRYGYMRILKELKDLTNGNSITLEDIPDLKNILEEV